MPAEKKILFLTGGAHIYAPYAHCLATPLLAVAPYIVGIKNSGNCVNCAV